VTLIAKNSYYNIDPPLQNVNANVFVPNVNAPVFVPSFSMPPPPIVTAPVQVSIS
jgi:hypothetical protein